MSQRVSGYQRQDDEHYPTPPWVVQIAANYLAQHTSRYIWAPADDEKSPLVQTLVAAGFQVVATRDNFLTKTAPPDPRIDVVVTNPPFGHGGRLACEFITRALALAPVVAMLLRVDFDSAKTRVHLFRDCPSFARKIILLDRITWFEREGAAGPSENHAWMIWNSRHRGPPTISYVRRP